MDIDTKAKPDDVRKFHLKIGFQPVLDESGWAKLASGCTKFRYPDDESPAYFQLSDNKDNKEDVRELLITERVIDHIFKKPPPQEEKQSSSSSSPKPSISNGKQQTSSSSSSVSRKRPLEEVVSPEDSSSSSPRPSKKSKLEESSSVVAVAVHRSRKITTQTKMIT